VTAALIGNLVHIVTCKVDAVRRAGCDTSFRDEFFTSQRHDENSAEFEAKGFRTSSLSSVGKRFA
jgi:hypothetical protein